MVVDMRTCVRAYVRMWEGVWAHVRAFALHERVRIGYLSARVCKHVCVNAWVPLKEHASVCV